MGIRKLRKEIAVAAMNRPPPRQTTSAMLSKSPLAPSRNAAEEASNTRAIAARVHSPQANALENIDSSQESTSRSPGGSEDTERRSAPPRPSLRPLPSVPSVAATESTIVPGAEEHESASSFAGMAAARRPSASPLAAASSPLLRRQPAGQLPSVATMCGQVVLHLGIWPRDYLATSPLYGYVTT